VRYHKIRQWVIDDKLIDLVKINTKNNPADMMTKTISMERFRVSLNFIKVLQRYGRERALEKGHVKSQNGRESTVNEVEANFYERTQ